MAQSNCGRDGRMAPPGSNKRMGAEAGFVPRFCHHDTRGAPSISLAQKTRTIADFPIRHRGAAYTHAICRLGPKVTDRGPLRFFSNVGQSSMIHDCRSHLVSFCYVPQFSAHGCVFRFPRSVGISGTGSEKPASQATVGTVFRPPPLSLPPCSRPSRTSPSGGRQVGGHP